MSLESDVRLLQRVALLSEFTEDKLRLLAFSAENRSFRNGQRLFSAGDRAESAYVIGSGEVALFTPGDAETPADVIRPGGLIGELSLVVDGERHFTAVAVGEVAAIQIRRPLFRRMLEEYPEVAQRLHARVADALVGTTRALMTVKARLDALEE